MKGIEKPDCNPIYATPSAIPNLDITESLNAEKPPPRKKRRLVKVNSNEFHTRFIVSSLSFLQSMFIFFDNVSCRAPE